MVTLPYQKGSGANWPLRPDNEKNLLNESGGKFWYSGQHCGHGFE